VLLVEGAGLATNDDSGSITTEVPSDDEPPVVVPSLSEMLPVASSTEPAPLQPASGVSYKPGVALLLFSGSSSRTSGSLQSHLELLGFTVEAYDILNGAAGDLSDDAVWDPLLRRIKSGIYTVAVISPPCSTFSRVRNVPGGPRPLSWS
jgi:hypothetical protein